MSFLYFKTELTYTYLPIIINSYFTLDKTACTIIYKTTKDERGRNIFTISFASVCGNRFLGGLNICPINTLVYIILVVYIFSRYSARSKCDL